MFERQLHGVSTGAWDTLPELYAEDTIVEHPFAPPGPQRRIEGRAAIREHFAQAARMPLELQADNLVVHETADPEVIVAEFDYCGRVTSTGETFQTRNIFVLRIRDGQIVTSRDYADHLGIARATGGLPRLVAALDGPTSPATDVPGGMAADMPGGAAGDRNGAGRAGSPGRLGFPPAGGGSSAG